MASARLFGRLLQEKGMSETRLGKIFEEVRAKALRASRGHWEVYTIEYTGCHWLGGNHRCM